MKNFTALLPLLCIFIILCGKENPGDENSEVDDKHTGKVYSVVDVYTSDDNHTVFVDSKEKDKINLIHDKDSVFEILEKTRDSKWVIVQKAPAVPGKGRIETTYMLFFTPVARHIDIESLNPDLSAGGIHFAEVFNELHLIAYLKGRDVPVPLSFEDLLEGGKLEIPAINDQDKVPETTGNEKIILELELGKNLGQTGITGETSRQIKDGNVPRTIYAMPSFAVHRNLLYIIDALNFRVAVYDLKGDPVRQIGYPRNTENGKTVIMIDIAVDEDFIYLLTSTGLYVIDSETDDIVTVIDKNHIPGEGLQDFQNVEICNEGGINIFDYLNNQVYTFQKEKQGFSFNGAEQYIYSSTQHLAEKMYTVSVISEKDNQKPGRYFVIKKKDDSLSGIFDSGHGKCQARIFSVDRNGNIYVIVDEIEQPGSQFPEKRTIRVVSQAGKQLYSLEVKSWPGGPMNRNLIVTKTGEIFEAFYDLETGYEAEPASKLTVKRLK